MIDLSLTREALLRGIGASDLPRAAETDPWDLSASAGTRARVRGTGLELFPILRIVLEETFAQVPRASLLRDLLTPLKNALGNAHKRGNGRDPGKVTEVELVVTPKGAFIAVTDQGPGFDYELTVRRFRDHAGYFVNHGSGLRNLDRAGSVICWENGGRTLLLGFRTATAVVSRNARRELPARVPPLSRGLDPARLRESLPAELAPSGAPAGRIEACRVRRAEGDAADCRNRLLLRLEGREGARAGTKLLCWRLHANEAEAAADFHAASALLEVGTRKALHVPRPAARPAHEPRLVLYDFDPWMNLWEYATNRESPRSLRRAAVRAGRTLGALHRSAVALPGAPPRDAEVRIEARFERAVRSLQALPCGTDLTYSFLRSLHRALRRGKAAGRPAAAPIHGSLGWDTIYYGTDNRFYLFHFEKSRVADPALDLGGFAADLRCFTLDGRDEESYVACRDALLENYNDRGGCRVTPEDLRLDVSLAVSERLIRAAPMALMDAERLLRAAVAA